MNITLVKRTIDLLKKANDEDFVTLAELARELKTTKTILMAFIEDNKNLFHTGKGKKLERFNSLAVNPGLIIFDARLSPDDNLKQTRKTKQQK